MEGWIKLHRKLLSSKIFSSEKILKIWIWCLLKASSQEYETIVGMTNVKLEKGQFIFGRKNAAEELKMNENTIYKYMKVLEKEGNINIKSNNKYSIVTIEKWGQYQFNEEINNSKSNNKITTKEHKQEYKEIINNKIYISNKEDITPTNLNDFNNYFESIRLKSKKLFNKED